MAIVVEIGNIYVAQAQLENALEAAALAAVLEWGGEPPAASTADARLVGEEYGNANEVCGQRLGDLDPIDPNYQAAPGGDANDNASCSGDLVFGAVSFAEPFVFQANVEPQCTVEQQYGTATMKFSVDTTGCRNPGDTPGSVTTTFRCPEGWTFEFDAATGAAATSSVVSVTIQLRAAGTDNGQFDFDTRTTPPAPTQEVYGVAPNPDPREGYGPFVHASSDVPAGDVSFYQDFAGTISVPVNGTAQSDTLTVLITPGVFQVGDALVIGVDTDMMGPDGGEGDPADTRDDGRDAKFAGADFKLTFTFDNGAILIIDATEPEVLDANNKTFINSGRAKDLSVIIPGTGSYGVHAQKTISVPSLCGGVLGINTSFNVCAEATALWRCDIEDVSLIHLSDFQCTPP